MGLLEWLGYRDVVAPSAYAASRGVVSPWAGPSHLAKLVVDDIFGIDTQAVTRAEAMSIPAVAKARNLICGTLGRQPLRAYRDGATLPDQPTWLYRTDTQVTPRMRTMWVLDDVLFYGWSLLAVQRGAEGQILDAQRVPPARWKFDAVGRVLVDDHEVAHDDVVLIPGPFEGLLTAGARTVRAARKLEEQWTARVKNPVPVVEIRYTGDEDLEEHEMREIRTSYIAARNDPEGTVMVTPRGFEVHPHGDQALELFVNGRNAVTLDIARFCNIPAIMLDASNVNATSVNYSNEAVGRSELRDLTLRFWALTVEERLSADDCTPRGTTIAFDLSDLTVPDVGTGPRLED